MIGGFAVLAVVARVNYGGRADGEGADVGDYIGGLKVMWLWMLQPPWRHSGRGDEQPSHWFIWLLGWAWSLAGLVLGAVVAPSLVQVAGLSATPYQGALMLGGAVLAGFLAQALGWCYLALIFGIGKTVSLPKALGWPVLLVVFVFPLAGVVYALYPYFTRVGASQEVVTIVFVGSLFVKAFLIPSIKAIATGVEFKVIKDWLRGGKPKSA
jgi:hypothetical protein